MATITTTDEKSAPELTVNTTGLAVPPKAAASIDKPSATSTTSPENGLELRRESSPATPQSYKNDDENPFDTDVEAMITETSSREAYLNGKRKSLAAQNKSDCPSVWPSMEHWKQKAKSAKRNRHSCHCMGSLSKRNRIIVKILIGLLIVGVGLGVGFGISKTLGAPIWGDNNGD